VRAEILYTGAFDADRFTHDASFVFGLSLYGKAE